MAGLGERLPLGLPGAATEGGTGNRGRKRGQGLRWPMTRTDRGGTGPPAPEPHRQSG